MDGCRGAKHNVALYIYPVESVATCRSMMRIYSIGGALLLLGTFAVATRSERSPRRCLLCGVYLLLCHSDMCLTISTPEPSEHEHQSMRLPTPRCTHTPRLATKSTTNE